MTAITRNRQWVLRQRPDGAVSEDHFEYREGVVPSPGEGEVLLRNLYLSFDPAQRGWLEPTDSYVAAIEIGEVMRSGSVARVVESRHSGFQAGDLVQATAGWQDFAVVPGKGPGSPRPIPDNIRPTYALSLLGGNGLTAYFGLLRVGQARAGDVVVVSSAAGATGSIAGQIARLKGCRVIGIAGGPEKCRWLMEDAGFHGAIDYKSGDIGTQIAKHCPQGVDVYFDNVGGPTLEAVLDNLARGARVAMCGAISGYQSEAPLTGPSNLINLVLNSASMNGFLLTDFAKEFRSASADLLAWTNAGDIIYREDIQQGFDRIPRTLIRLFQGANQGKQILEIDLPDRDTNNA